MNRGRRRALLGLGTWPMSALALPASAAGAGAAVSAGASAPDSPVWPRVVASVFNGRPIATATADVLRLAAPARAVDAAFVPVTVLAGDPGIRRITLVVDNNPAPVAAVLQFGAAVHNADLETRLRVDEYSWVRAVAERADGTLVMAARYVKAAGGCSAPAGADAQAAAASLGRMQLQVDQPVRGQPTVLRWQISHPNHSGLAMDQATRHYTPAHFVRLLDLHYDGQPLLHAELDFALSENPSLRLQFTPQRAGLLQAQAEDTQGRRFDASLAVSPA